MPGSTLWCNDKNTLANDTVHLLSVDNRPNRFEFSVSPGFGGSNSLRP
jgi:hypothetical protein